ncbi:hypothetical protein QR680_015396 [Steinernema hermaphroditum]|uniref:Uncharacterized protein n=1 Tax=Steinernema hermaphroditum TaxID=289476 RepID=A0AA39H7I7_9BILA|nr:hypothetical protein QR680_015396 [Steinernema hermaphroditum]
MDNNMTIETLARKEGDNVTEIGDTVECDVVHANEQAIATTVAFMTNQKKQGIANSDWDNGGAPAAKAVRKEEKNSAPNLVLFISLGALITILTDVAIFLAIGIEVNWKF